MKINRGCKNKCLKTGNKDRYKLLRRKFQCVSVSVNCVATRLRGRSPILSSSDSISAAEPPGESLLVGKNVG